MVLVRVIVAVRVILAPGLLRIGRSSLARATHG